MRVVTLFVFSRVGREARAGGSHLCLHNPCFPSDTMSSSFSIIALTLALIAVALALTLYMFFSKRWDPVGKVRSTLAVSDPR